MSKVEPKERGCVRSRANFRQGIAKKARVCPKMSQLQTRKSQKSEGVSKVEPTSDKEEPQSTMMSEEIPKNPEPHDFNRGDYKEELLGRDESLWYYKRTMHLKNCQNLYEVCRKINSVTNYRWIINENCIE